MNEIKNLYQVFAPCLCLVKEKPRVCISENFKSVVLLELVCNPVGQYACRQLSPWRALYSCSPHYFQDVVTSLTSFLPEFHILTNFSTWRLRIEATIKTLAASQYRPSSHPTPTHMNVVI